MSKPPEFVRNRDGLPSRSAIGGASNEAGAGFRSAVAAWIISHGLRGKNLPSLGLVGDAVPVVVALETDDPVDDIAVTLSSGLRALFQAKRSLTLDTHRGSDFVSVVNQWKEALRSSALNPDADRLVLVMQIAGQSLRDLRDALNRSRAEVAGAHRRQERESLNKLLDRVADLTEDQRQTLLRCAYVLTLDLEEDGKADAGTAEALLDGMVVASGEGRRAWRELKSYASELAQRREGRSIQGWMEALRRAGLHLVADVEKSAAARREAMRLAEVAYRQHLAAQISSIDLRGVGFTLRPLPVCLLVPMYVTPTDDREENTRDGQRSLKIEMAIRRRGRALLLGLPGSGKSTALRVAASYWVNQPDWPLPLVVNLKELISSLVYHAPLDGITELVTRDLASGDQGLITQRIRERAQDGSSRHLSRWTR